MKHAVLIMAHKEIEHLCRLVRYFERDCYVFIHIDKKSDIKKEDIRKLERLEQVAAVYRKFSVHWGGFSILRCEMFMLREALARCDAEYFHLISGQDYPVCPLNDFLDFFEENSGKSFIQYVHLPHPRWEGCTFTRFQYFYIYDWMKNGKKSYRFVKKIVDFQKRHALKRRVPDCFDHLYGNSQWFSICRKAVSDLLDYTRSHPALYRRMWMTFAPEESYISTVLVNLNQGRDIVPCNYRYIRWKYENGSTPANLCMKHFHFLLERKYLFARKFESPYCKELAETIDKYIVHGEKDVRVMENGGWDYDGFLRYSYEGEFTRAVLHICKYIKVNSALDMGCGAGAYVAALRREGLAVAGYDANPNTEKLSGLLLPEDDEPCGQASLTEDLEVEDKFDLVICKDVLPYIPENLETKAIENLALLSAKYILVSWYMQCEPADEGVRCRQEEEVVSLFECVSFKMNRELSAQIREQTGGDGRKLYYLFESKH